MALFTNYTGITSLIYAAATVIVRYVYVSSSLKPNVQAVVKRNAFILKSNIIAQSLGCVILMDGFFFQLGKSGKERSPYLAYQTCLNPYTQNFTKIIFNIMPATQILLYVTNFCIIFFYLSLYKYLDKQREESKGKGTFIKTVSILQ